MCHSVSMKNKNQRELEKYWAEQAAKKAKLAKKKESQEEPSTTTRESATKPAGKNKDDTSAM